MQKITMMKEYFLIIIILLLNENVKNVMLVLSNATGNIVLYVD